MVALDGATGELRPERYRELLDSVGFKPDVQWLQSGETPRRLDPGGSLLTGPVIHVSRGACSASAFAPVPADGIARFSGSRLRGARWYVFELFRQAAGKRCVHRASMCAARLSALGLPHGSSRCREE